MKTHYYYILKLLMTSPHTSVFRVLMEHNLIEPLANPSKKELLVVFNSTPDRVSLPLIIRQQTINVLSFDRKVTVSGADIPF